MMVRLEQRILSTLHLILRVPPFWPDRKLPSNVLQKKYSRMENMREIRMKKRTICLNWKKMKTVSSMQ